MLAYSPMASGMLTGAFDAARIAASIPTTGAATRPCSRSRCSRETWPSSSDSVPLADRLGTTLPALAVAWTLAQPGVTAAIVGARLPRHVDGWLPASELELGDDELHEIDDAIAETGAGTDESPAPPPHMRPAVEQASQ